MVDLPGFTWLRADFEHYKKRNWKFYKLDIYILQEWGSSYFTRDFQFNIYVVIISEKLDLKFTL